LFERFTTELIDKFNDVPDSDLLFEVYMLSRIEALIDLDIVS